MSKCYIKKKLCCLQFQRHVCEAMGPGYPTLLQDDRESSHRSLGFRHHQRRQETHHRIGGYGTEGVEVEL